MNLKPKKEASFELLRTQATQIIKQRGTKNQGEQEFDLLRLLNEIEVYQVELELQNQELRRSTKELEAARNEYFTLYDSAPVPFVTLDNRGMIGRLNAAAARMLGPGSLLEESYFARLIHAADQSVFFSYINNNATDKEQPPCELRFRRKDEQLLFVHLIASSIFDTQKQFIGWRLALIDVTGNKQHEQAMIQTQDELERRARQLARLTLELTLAEHRERRRLAELMHDHLQQLLAGARMHLEIAIHETAPDQNTALSFAYDLVVKSIETSRTLSAELSPPVLSQQGLSEALRWLARWMGKTHALHIDLRLDEGDTPLQEEIKLLMFQSVRELLFNVTKHAKTKSAKVEMICRDAQARVVVSDSGVGFDPQWLFQTDTDNGFGLFSIRERLLLLDGTFEIVSSLNKGTIVTLTAPIRTQACIQLGQNMEATNGVLKADCPAIVIRKRPGDKIKVMLVDDHLVVRNGICALLSMHADIEVAGEASNGEEAVELARKIRPDVILMDINMPQMNGVEATRTIKLESPDIQIIGLSMYEADDQASAMKKAGAAGYLSKSSNSNILLAAIRQHGGSCLNSKSVISVGIENAEDHM